MIGEQLEGGAVGNDATLVDDDRPGAQLGRVEQVVGDHEGRAPAGGDELGELTPGERVEVGGGLVEDHDRGVHGQHGGERHPPALADAQVVRRPGGGVGHADRGEALLDPGLELGAGEPEVRRAEGDVPADRGHEELVVGVLEDDADPSADLAEVVVVDGQAVHDDAAGVGTQDPVEVQHEGGLARAVRPEDGEPLARSHPQVQAVQRPVAVRVGERHPSHLDGGRRAHHRSEATGRVTTTALPRRWPTRWRATAGRGASGGPLARARCRGTSP